MERHCHGREREHGNGKDMERYRDNKRGRRNDYRTKHQPAPDYIINPSKWKKYNLSHDGTEGLKHSGMTDDQVNSFAAFNFLQELRERKERDREMAAGEEEEIELDSRGERKVVFWKSSKRKQQSGDREGGGEDSRPAAKSAGDEERVCAGGAGVGAGVVKMAEYVVGEGGGASGGRKGRKRKQLQLTREEEEGEEVGGTAPQKPHSSSISLSHLAELNEEED